MPSVRIVEVSPRDGLQNIKTTIPTSTKLSLIQRLHAAGLQTIELTSAVSPKAVPQLADCQTVLSDDSVQTLLATPARLPVLVPNVRGLDVAIKHGVREVAVFVSATEAFSKANTNCTVKEGLERARLVAEKAKQAGLAVRGYSSCIFADPFEGPTPHQAVLASVQALLAMGCYEVSLGDTTGVGVASDVKSLLNYLERAGIPLSKLAGHFHDTYGQAVSNVWTAYQCGVRVFDSSVSGLGGCPFAPGAKGNVATEDLVYMFHQAGIDTGVDLNKLVETGGWISSQLAKTNDSRAEAALLAPATSGRKAVTGPSAPKSRIDWKEWRSGEGINILRAGVNVKIVMNRPRNGNALTFKMIDELTTFFDEAAKDDTITRIVLTGGGKFFCTGMDLAKDSTAVGQSTDLNEKQYTSLVRLLKAIDDAPQVTIAAINGPAFGGGIGLAFACDIRLSVSTEVTLSEVKLGLAPATISPYVLREWGVAFAREAMLSGRRISMTELQERGIVTRVATSEQQLGELVDEYLVQLRTSSPAGSKLSKDLVRLSIIGGQTQNDGVKKVFEEMMKTGAQGDIGVKHFQKTKKHMDWDAYGLRRDKAKL